MNLLVTGGAGFIGSNFVHYWHAAHPDDRIVVFDALTYAGNRANLAHLGDAITFVHGDITDLSRVEETLREHAIDVIVNFAAESHNSYAIVNPGVFFRTNVVGTQTLCEAARRVGVARLHHVSTCEVYGDLALDSDEMFTEESPYAPRTPYNASKAGGDHAVRAYFETFGLPVTITNCANNYGPYQFPEKGAPALHDSCARRSTVAALRINREPTRVDSRTRPLPRDRPHPATAAVGETYHVGTGVERSDRGDRRLRACDTGQAGVAEDDRSRPSRSRPTVRARLDEDSERDRLDAADHFRGRTARDRALVRAAPFVVGTATRPGSGRRSDRLVVSV
jgi:dTDP-glucose 4,6-dehydratase